MTSLTLFVLKIDCSVFKVTVNVTSFKNIVPIAKRFQPSLGNSNVHRRRNLERERSASEIVSYCARVKYYCLRQFHCSVLLTIETLRNSLVAIPGENTY